MKGKHPEHSNSTARILAGTHTQCLSQKCHTFPSITVLARTLVLTLLAVSAMAQERGSCEAQRSSQSGQSDGLGPVTPDALTPVLSLLRGNKVTDWMQKECIRFYGWLDAGYTYTTAGKGLLSIVDGRYGTAPTPNRFGDEFILNGAWFILDRLPSEQGWSWGFRADFETGTEAALFHPLNGFGPTGQHLGADFRQIYLSLHAPILSKRGVDFQLGRQNVPIGYGSLMGPYRQLYSETYVWIFFQVVATGAIATWHATDRLDLLGGVLMNYNTDFVLRGRAPSYIGKFTYQIGAARKTTVVGTVYTGPQPVPIVPAQLGSWQTVAEVHVSHNWSRRITQIVQANGSWDAGDPRVEERTAKTYGANTTTTFHLDKKLDLNVRGEWFRDERGVRTGLPGTFSEATIGVNVMPNKWISLRPELRGDFAAQPSYGRLGGGPHKPNEFSAALDLICKF
jgi:hypothetical protein